MGHGRWGELKLNIRFVDVATFVRCGTTNPGYDRFCDRALNICLEHAAPAQGRLLAD